MTLEKLKWFRLLIPGSLIILVGSQFFTSLEAVAAAWKSLWPGPFSVFALVVGALYDVLDVRDRVLEPERTRVDNNIKDKLLSLCADDHDIAAREAQLKQSRALMHVFYGLVDNDKTLSEKAKLVRFNGLIWSTAADVVVIGVLFAILYFFAAWVTMRLDYFIATLVLLCAATIARAWLLPAVTERHIQASNEQLEFIELHHATDLCAQVRTRARGL